MTAPSPLAPTPANDNGNALATPTGAYLHVLRARADLLRENPAAMAPDYYARWRAALAEIEGALSDIRPHL